MTILRCAFNPSVCILDKKYLVAMRKSPGYIEIYDLNTFKLLSKLININFIKYSGGIKIFNCGKSGFFIYNRQKSCCESFIAEFNNNTLKDVFCLYKISPFSSFLYLDDFILVGEEGKIIIFKKELRTKEGTKIE